MENQNQDSPPQSPTNPPPDTSRPLLGGQKVVQPTSAILNEIQSQPTGTSLTPVRASETTLPPLQAQPQSPQPTSRYPTATEGIGAAHGQNALLNSTEQTDDDTNKKNAAQVVVVFIMVLGACIAISALLSLVSWSRIISFGSLSATNAFVRFIDAVYVLLGLGIMFRKNIARMIYIFIAIITLALSAFGTIRIVTQQHSQSAKSANLQIQLQYDISYCLTKPPSQQRNQMVQQLEKDINTKQQPDQTCYAALGIRSNEYVALIPGYLIAIIPLIFLTRTSVKEQFI